jgi:hypothetical protein
MKEGVINYLANIALVRNHISFLINNSRGISKEDSRFLSKKISEIDNLFVCSLKLEDVPEGFKDIQNTERFEDDIDISGGLEYRTDEKIPPTFGYEACGSCEDSKVNNEVKKRLVFTNTVFDKLEEDVKANDLPTLEESESNPKEEIKNIEVTDEDDALLKKRLAEEKKKLQKTKKSSKNKKQLT